MIRVPIVIFSTTAVALLAVSMGFAAENHADVSTARADLAHSEAGADAFRTALDDYARAVQARVRVPNASADARFRASAQDVRNAGMTFLGTVQNADGVDRAKVRNGIDEFDSAGARRVVAADEQRSQRKEYSTRSRAMAARTEEAIDRAWMLFGRVFARESLVAINARIVELRRHAEGLDGARGSNLDAVSEALAADEAAIAATLAGDAAGLTKSQGGDWFARMEDDLASLSTARTKLQRLDVHQSVLATRFAELEARLERTSELRHMETPPASEPPQTPSEAQPALTAPAQEVVVADASNTPAAVETTRPTEAPEASGRVEWIGAAILALVAILAVAVRSTVLSRRKRTASSSPPEDAADPLTIAFDRVTERLTRAESTLTGIEPLYANGSVVEEQRFEPVTDNEAITLQEDDARISVQFDDADRRAPKKASPHGRGADAVGTKATLHLAEQELRRRFENDELSLVAQPELDPDTLQVVSVEARVSVHEPDGRPSSTSDILAVSEQSDLIVRIGNWALRSAIEMAARWHHGNWPQGRVTVNVASAQLVEPRFVERVKTLLDVCRLPPSCIEIGLTDAVLRNTATLEVLRQLRAHGLGIALNDFGVGYSSLASLQRMPLTRIKLDRSLANEIDTLAPLPVIGRNVTRWAGAVGLRIGSQDAGQPEQLVHALREGSSCVVRHFMRCDRAGQPAEVLSSQWEWAGSYESYIAFPESFVLKQVAPATREAVVRRASVRAD